MKQNLGISHSACRGWVFPLQSQLNETQVMWNMPKYLGTLRRHILCIFLVWPAFPHVPGQPLEAQPENPGESTKGQAHGFSDLWACQKKSPPLFNKCVRQQNSLEGASWAFIPWAFVRVMEFEPLPWVQGSWHPHVPATLLRRRLRRRPWED